VTRASSDRSANAGSAPPARTHARVSELVELHVDAVWRTLRRLGMPPTELDDGVQQVFTVLARRIAGVEPGRERSFLLGVALRVVADHRRARRRHPEDATEASELERRAPQSSSPEKLLDERRRLELLDRLLARLPEDLAKVFVLFELEEMTMAEIARLLAVPSGTVASRLRRAREHFDGLCRDLEVER
jgi:RNA polymerase sigma-70 factor (ECF subfamily)